jgi:biopolymer transport protein ExbD
MRLKRRPARMPGETIVAMIDVVFFLLVFFMLVGRMDATAPFEVLPPVAGVGEPMPRGGATVSVAADGRLALDGRAVEEPALLDALAEGEREVIRVNAHSGVELRRLLPLVEALEALEAGEVVLVVTPEAR